LDAESRWEHPAELVQRLTATASLDRLADLVTSATTPAQLQATAQFILTQLAKIDLPTSPASELERDVLAFMDLAGGHGAPNFQMS
jgi:hypothetical protein